MLLKELVLTSLEGFDDFKIQHHYYSGRIKELPLTEKLYLENANKEVENYYIDVTENGKPYISVKLEN